MKKCIVNKKDNNKKTKQKMERFCATGKHQATRQKVASFQQIYTKRQNAYAQFKNLYSIEFHAYRNLYIARFSHVSNNELFRKYYSLLVIGFGVEGADV